MNPIISTNHLTRTLIKFSLPLMLSGLLQQLYLWVDAFLVGNLIGEDALASIGATVAFLNLLIYAITGFASGVGILGARHYGGGNLQIQKYILYTFSLVVSVTAFAVAAVSITLTDPLLTALATPADIRAAAGTYLRILLCGVPLLAIYNIYTAVLRGIGNTRVPLYAILISSLANFALDLLFILVFGWGITGAAVATFLAQGGMALFVVLYATQKYPFLRFQRNRKDMETQSAPFEGADIRTGKDIFGDLPAARDGYTADRAYDPLFRKDILSAGLTLALPITLQSIITSLGGLILQNFMNHFGSQVVAAVTTAYRVDMVLLVPMVNLGTALSTMASQCLGAGEPRQAKRYLTAANKVMLLVGATLILLVYLLGQPLIHLFGVSTGTAVMGAGIILRLAAFYPIFGIATALRGYLEGISDVIYTSAVGIIALLARIALSYGCIGLWDYNVIAYAEGLSWVVMAVLLFARYMQKRNTTPSDICGTMN